MLNTQIYKMSLKFPISLVGKSGAIWSPEQDASSNVFWDATDASTITTSGNNVTTFTDKLKGAVMTPQLGGNGPEYGIDKQNGNYYLSHKLNSSTGRSDHSLISTGFGALGNSLLYCILIRPTQGVRELFDNGINKKYRVYHGKLGQTNWYPDHFYPSILGSWTILTWQLDYNGGVNGTSSLYINGVLNDPVRVKATSPTSTTQRWSTCSNHIYSYGSPCDHMMMALSNDISDENRQRYEGFFAYTAGIENQLPSDHPYKNNPPQAI